MCLVSRLEIRRVPHPACPDEGRKRLLRRVGSFVLFFRLYARQKSLLLANGNVRVYKPVICPLFGFYFHSPEGEYDPPPELWERGNPAVFAGFPSAGENLFLVFPEASFPQLFPGSFSAAKRPTQCGP